VWGENDAAATVYFAPAAMQESVEPAQNRRSAAAPGLTLISRKTQLTARGGRFILCSGTTG
jgi:hypothetical protein